MKLMHDSLDLFMIDFIATIQKIMINTSHTIIAIMFIEDIFDIVDNFYVFVVNVFFLKLVIVC